MRPGRIICAAAIATAMSLTLATAAAARSSGGRVYYGRGHHTSTHGGSCSGGGSGSSHRGGHYENSNTGKGLNSPEHDRTRHLAMRGLARVPEGGWLEGAAGSGLV